MRHSGGCGAGCGGSCDLGLAAGAVVGPPLGATPYYGGYGYDSGYGYPSYSAMAKTDLAITDTPLGRIRAIAIIMRQHGPRIMRIGRAGKEVKAAAS